MIWGITIEQIVITVAAVFAGRVLVQFGWFLYRRWKTRDPTPSIIDSAEFQRSRLRAARLLDELRDRGLGPDRDQERDRRFEQQLDDPGQAAEIAAAVDQDVLDQLEREDLAEFGGMPDIKVEPRTRSRLTGVRKIEI